MVNKPTLSLDHVGWVTNDLKKFESFWVEILGFKKVSESKLSPEMTKSLFGIDGGAKCLRYSLHKITIECHIFNKNLPRRMINFQSLGLNHIALYVKNREEFLGQHDFKTHIYHNPGGWDNIFIRDFEGNWIELRGDI